MREHDLNIPTNEGETSLKVSHEHPLFILGRNGTGKSAMMQLFRAQIGNDARYLPGSRPSYFDSESLNMTPASRKSLEANMMSWDVSPETRWKSLSGTSRNERAIHDLTTSETQFKVDAANKIANEGGTSDAIALLRAKNSPLDMVNFLLTQANLPIRVKISQGELMAVKDGNEYSIAKTSDGERIALILIAEVVSAPKNTVFIIDEPELHLHRAIVVPLIAALLSQRADCSFVVSTHELDLPAEHDSASVIILRNAHWEGDTVREWDIDLITSSIEIPESLRVDVIGSRRKIVFVEGAKTSLDTPMYSLLFPEASIRGRADCLQVERAVTGLRSIQDQHRITAFGIIDGDGMTPAQINSLREKHVYPLPTYSIESLYYSSEVIQKVASSQANQLRLNEADLIARANADGLAALSGEDVTKHLASRLAERKLRDQLMAHVPDRTTLSENPDPHITFSIPSTFTDELERITQFRDAEDLQSIISIYPVRHSGVLLAIANALNFPNRAKYEQAALNILSSDQELKDVLRSKLGDLSNELGA